MDIDALNKSYSIRNYMLMLERRKGCCKSEHEYLGIINELCDKHTELDNLVNGIREGNIK